jgi:hypothetical protein
MLPRLSRSILAGATPKESEKVSPNFSSQSKSASILHLDVAEIQSHQFASKITPTVEAEIPHCAHREFGVFD